MGVENLEVAKRALTCLYFWPSWCTSPLTLSRSRSALGRWLDSL